ncbi:hypothetical protein CL618_00285 [archaeon]|nr:hypothetical protein [archaeon]|tara:strand:- start:537 stop:782 length:246 start_codon:yes stop_codon:yes gene_type:complete
MTEKISEAIEVLEQISQDSTVPKNVREKTQNAITALKEENIEIPIRISRSMQELDDLSEDQNVPIYTRTQILNVVTILESI